MSRLDELRALLAETFSTEQATLDDEASPERISGWDSLTHITLIMTIEDTFGVKFTTREVMGFQNVGEMLSCLSKKL